MVVLHSDKDHIIIYEKQYKHPSFNGLTKTKQEFIKNKLTTLGYKF